ncbi:MAG: cation diffusion facilitator family transporter [Clostridiales bacterium]|nr:cation diffusion facilitator family transporter [Clostridiales bacterium]
MSELLIRLFVKDPSQRHKYGLLAGVVGIICNVILASTKIVLGLVTGAVSIVTDAVNNLSDAVSSVVTLVGFKISGKPADREHPYGHGRVEYITGFVVSAAVIAVAIELFKESVSNIIHPEELDVSIVTIVFLALTIVIKLWMSVFYGKIAKKISSEAMRATATDSRADCITTGVALISVLIMLISGINIDGYAGALVAILVVISGVRSAKETIAPILGEAPDKEFLAELEKEVRSNEGILGVHDIRIHEYGHSTKIVSLHVEMPDDVPLVKVHDVIDIIEKDLVSKGFASEVTIHVDPVATDDQEMLGVRSCLEGYLKTVNGKISIHDFRLIRETDCKRLIFEILVPYDDKHSDSELKGLIEGHLKETGKDYDISVTVDRE